MEGLTSLGHIPTGHQLADVLTKPLVGSLHHDILSKLGVSTLTNLSAGAGDNG